MSGCSSFVSREGLRRRRKIRQCQGAVTILALKAGEEAYFLAWCVDGCGISLLLSGVFSPCLQNVMQRDIDQGPKVKHSLRIGHRGFFEKSSASLRLKQSIRCWHNFGKKKISVGALRLRNWGPKVSSTSGCGAVVSQSFPRVPKHQHQHSVKGKCALLLLQCTHLPALTRTVPLHRSID